MLVILLIVCCIRRRSQADRRQRAQPRKDVEAGTNAEAHTQPKRVENVELASTHSGSTDDKAPELEWDSGLPFERTVRNPLFRDSMVSQGSKGPRLSTSSFQEIVSVEQKPIAVATEPEQPVVEPPAKQPETPSVPAASESKPTTEVKPEEETPAVDKRAARLAALRAAREKKKADEWQTLTEALQVIDDMAFDEC